MPELPLFEAEILKTCHSLEQSESVLLIGEAGSGKSYIAAAICKHFEQQGWTAAIALSFFNDSATAADTFHKYGSQQLVTIEVQGIHKTTSQQVSDTFTVIEASQNDVIAESLTTGLLYKIGSGIDVQIQPTAIRTRLGDRLTIQSQTLDVQELPFEELLSRCPTNAYLSGSLLVDDLEDAPLQRAVVSYPTLATYGNQLELSNDRPIELAQLRDFWILHGRLVIKVRAQS